MTRLMFGLLFTAIVLVGANACGNDDSPSLAPISAASDATQPPPMGREAVEAWLATGAYKAWACEPAAHAGRSPSPHGQNRICSNSALSKAGSGEYPVGAASVKELLSDAGQLIGFAVARHTSAGTSGDTWYWYERVPADHPAPHDTNGVVADGLGSGGAAKSICVGCHAGAGSDAAHAGHDMVYTQVR